MSLNKVMLIGNVGRDPEVRYLEGNSGAQNATKVASFTLATTERYRDRNGELRENTEWHNIVAWRNSADLAEKFIRKGTQVYIEGKLRTRSWTDQQGVKKFTTEVVVDNIQLLGKRGDNPGGEPDPAGAEEPDAFGDEVVLEGVEGAPLFHDLLHEFAGLVRGHRVGRKLGEVEVVVEDLAGVVENGRDVAGGA